MWSTWQWSRVTSDVCELRHWYGNDSVDVSESEDGMSTNAESNMRPITRITVKMKENVKMTPPLREMNDTKTGQRKDDPSEKIEESLKRLGFSKQNHLIERKKKTPFAVVEKTFFVQNASK